MSCHSISMEIQVSRSLISELSEVLPESVPLNAISEEVYCLSWSDSYCAWNTPIPGRQRLVWDAFIGMKVFYS